MNTVAYVFLADGFEEIEAVTPVDIMRRAGITVKTVGVTGNTVHGAHGIIIQADIDAKGFVLPEDAALVFLPGGGAGTENLGKSDVVLQALHRANTMGIVIAAICAAPTILHNANLLDGRRATAFPSMQCEMTRSIVTGAAVEIDGNIITGRAAGVAVQFSHALVQALKGTEAADAVIAKIYP